jgi:hypothetical protein
LITKLVGITCAVEKVISFHTNGPFCYLRKETQSMSKRRKIQDCNCKLVKTARRYRKRANRKPKKQRSRRGRRGRRRGRPRSKRN